MLHKVKVTGEWYVYVDSNDLVDPEDDSEIEYLAINSVNVHDEAEWEAEVIKPKVESEDEKHVS